VQIHYLASFGIRSVADGVRYISKRLATNKMWSQISLHGQSGKRVLGATLLMDVIASKWLLIAYIECFLKIYCY